MQQIDAVSVVVAILIGSEWIVTQGRLLAVAEQVAVAVRVDSGLVFVLGVYR